MRPARFVAIANVIIAMLFGSRPAMAQIECDEPMCTMPEAAVQASDPEAPAAPVVRRVLPPPSIPRPRLPWERSISVGLISGVTKAALLMGPVSDPAAFVGGDLRFLWSRAGKRWGIGVRLGAAQSIGLVAEESAYESSSQGAGNLLMLDAGFLMEVHGFWFSGGLGFMHFSMDDDSVSLPGLQLSLGYDLSLGRHVALRIHASGHTLLVTASGQLGAGIVVRL